MTNLNEMKSTELKTMAKELKVKNWWNLKKEELIQEITKLQAPVEKKVYTEESISEKKTSTTSTSGATEEEIRVINKIYNMGEFTDNQIFLSDCKFHLKKNPNRNEIINSLESKGYIILSDKGKFGTLKLTEKSLSLIEVEPDSENLITLKEIIIDLGIKGTKARRILRNADILRPFNRWEWDKTEHAKIIQRVMDLLSK